MAEVDKQLIELPTDIKNANTIKDVVINRLFKDGLITEEQADMYIEQWGILIIKDGWFKSWVAKFKKSSDTWRYVFINLGVGDGC